MKILNRLDSLSRNRKKIYLAAGFFDGVHVGHQKVLGRTIEMAKDNNGSAWCLTFDTHPLKVLAPEKAPLLLTSNRHKVHLLETYGMDGCLLLPFTRQLAGLPPSEFVARLKTSIPALAGVAVGSNWRFGHKGEGCPAVLSRLGKKNGFEVSVVRPAVRAGGMVSSTRTRKAVAGGNLDAARHMLGRDFSILGTVTRGRTLGRQLGFPTANIEHQNEVFPPCGVYAVYAHVYFESGRPNHHYGVLNMGVNPTFGGEPGNRPGLELHLFDFNSDIYGREVEVFFVRKLRNERKFSSMDKLRGQIALDGEKARNILEHTRKKLKKSKT